MGLNNYDNNNIIYLSICDRHAQGKTKFVQVICRGHAKWLRGLLQTWTTREIYRKVTSDFAGAIPDRSSMAEAEI